MEGESRGLRAALDVVGQLQDKHGALVAALEDQVGGKGGGAVQGWCTCQVGTAWVLSEVRMMVHINSHQLCHTSAAFIVL
jgi:hypothetical protein